MTCTETRRRLEVQLASIEAQVVEARRMLVAGLPCDGLLATIGAVQMTLEEVAAAIPELYGEQCRLRLTPDEFCAEFERTFMLRISRCRTVACSALTTRRAVPA
jgi:DNA-binding FrmR family transcriptional regulator